MTSSAMQGHLSFTVQRSNGESVELAHTRAVAALVAAANARGADGVVGVSVAYLDPASLTLTAQPTRHQPS